MKTRRKQDLLETRTPSLLNEVLAAPICDSTPNAGVVVGTLLGFDTNGAALVAFPASRGTPIAARSTVVLGTDAVDHEVAVLFENGDTGRPVVVGLIQPNPSKTPVARDTYAVGLDRERIVLTASREIVLQCGDASITLTRAGKVIIRGAYVLSRSSGVNRIRGGSVQIN